MSQDRIPFICAPMGMGKTTAFLDYFIRYNKREKVFRRIQLVQNSIVSAQLTFNSLTSHIQRVKSDTKVGYMIDSSIVAANSDIMVTTIGYVNALSSEYVIFFD